MNRSNKREATRERMVTAAGQAFREHGLGGIGVDGLAKSADLTSGAFYVHFASKLDAFIESVKAGLDDLRHGIETTQAEHGPAWLSSFAEFYMGFKRTCSLGEGCTLPSLSAEVERAGDDARCAYEAKLIELMDTMSCGLPNRSKAISRDQAWVILALLSGGVSMARAVRDEALSKEIAGAIENAVISIGTDPEPASASEPASAG